jgi:type IV pilus assembly protein PilC
MTTKFKYEAKDAAGKLVKGMLTAASQSEVVADLRRRNLQPIDVTRAGTFEAMFAGGGAPTGKKTAKRASAKKGELDVFTRQLSTMLAAGIPMLEALEILAEQAESPGFAYCLDMVRAGEASGQIDVILTRLAEYLESSARLRSEIKAAMTYPVISLFLVLGIACFLMMGIVPSFKPVFESLEVDLPGLTVAIMETAIFMKDYWYVIFGGVGAAVVGVRVAVKTPAGAYARDSLFLRVPVFGILFKKVALSRFARTFSTLIKSGVPILGAMEIVSATSGNLVITKIVDDARNSVRNGESLADPFMKSTIFPPMVCKMISIGERSGALDSLLEKIAEFYDQQVEAEVNGLTAMIEPIMIAIMGIVVGGIVLAVFLPIFKLQEKLSGG